MTKEQQVVLEVMKDFRNRRIRAMVNDASRILADLPTNDPLSKENEARAILIHLGHKVD